MCCTSFTIPKLKDNYSFEIMNDKEDRPSVSNGWWGQNDIFIYLALSFHIPFDQFC